jgi:hypothetical protein
MVAEKKCLPSMGVLLKYQAVSSSFSEGALEIGSVYKSSRQVTNTASCDPSPRIQKTLKLANLKKYRLKPLGDRISTLQRFYYLGMKNIESIHHDRVYFKKECNEVPVGLGESMGTIRRLSVIIAKFPNIRCDQDQKQHVYSYASYPVSMFSQDRRKTWKTDWVVDERVKWELKVLGQKNRGAEKEKVFEYLERVTESQLRPGPGERWVIWSLDANGRGALGIVIPQGSDDPSKSKMMRRKLAGDDLSYDLSTLNSLRLRAL